MSILSRPALVLATCITAVVLGACNHHALEYRQVHIGVNGPDRMGVDKFESQAQLDASRLSELMGPAHYGKLVAQVNFSEEMVLAIYGSKRELFSGKMEIVEIYKYTGVKVPPIVVRVEVGRAPQPCGRAVEPAPFVVAVVKRPDIFSSVVDFEVQNVEDACH